MCATAPKTYLSKAFLTKIPVLCWTRRVATDELRFFIPEVSLASTVTGVGGITVASARTAAASCTSGACRSD